MKDIFETLEDKGYYGIDANIKTSLLEYGLIVNDNVDEDYQHKVIFVVDWKDYDQPKAYNYSYISDEDIRVIFDEDWFDQKGFLYFIRLTEKEFFNASLASQLDDMISYYGKLNILGDVFRDGYNLTELI